MNGRAFSKLEVFADEMLIATLKKLGADGKAVLKLLVPEGRSRVWGRLWYDEKNSVNAAEDLILTAAHVVEEGGPWSYSKTSKP